MKVRRKKTKPVGKPPARKTKKGKGSKPPAPKPRKHKKRVHTNGGYLAVNEFKQGEPYKVFYFLSRVLTSDETELVAESTRNAYELITDLPFKLAIHPGKSPGLPLRVTEVTTGRYIADAFSFTDLLSRMESRFSGGNIKDPAQIQAFIDKYYLSEDFHLTGDIPTDCPGVRNAYKKTKKTKKGVKPKTKTKSAKRRVRIGSRRKTSE